jgi:hypothetical protein
MDKQQLLNFVRRHRERLSLVGLVLGLVVFIAAGFYLQKRNQEQADQPAPLMLKKEELTPTKYVTPEVSNGSNKRHSYFLKPSPEELLEKITAMEGLNDEALAKQFVALRVLWPAYFFSAQGGDEKRQLLLDVAEDGFGVVIHGTVSINDYPIITELQPGDNVWVGGEITMVDPNGTGAVYLNIEYFGRSMPENANKPGSPAQ